MRHLYVVYCLLLISLSQASTKPPSRSLVRRIGASSIGAVSIGQIAAVSIQQLVRRIDPITMRP